MEGIALMLSTICVNQTFCVPTHVAPDVNTYQFLPRDLYLSAKERKDEMAKLAAELKGQTLNVTTLEDYPLSYVERVNGTKIGRGWAFEFFEVLMKKYDFKYNLIEPDFNIVGSTNDTEGSLMQMITKAVRKLFAQLK